MPKGKSYGHGKTPADEIMGLGSKPAPVKPAHYKPRPTNSKKFPQ